GHTVSAFTLPNVDLTNATSASIDLGMWKDDTSTALQYQLNGGAWRTYSTEPGGSPLSATYWWHSIDIPLTLPDPDLHQGTNVINFRTSNASQAGIAE